MEELPHFQKVDAIDQIATTTNAPISESSISVPQDVSLDKSPIASSSGFLLGALPGRAQNDIDNEKPTTSAACVRNVELELPKETFPNAQPWNQLQSTSFVSYGRMEDAREQLLLMKHPLMNSWTLWYMEVDRKKAWDEMQNEVVNFNTVEDFWSIQRCIKTPSELAVGTDYSLFKNGIRPMWEDRANRRGGRWIIWISRNHSNYNLIDNIWLDVALCLIGEDFMFSDQVCGGVVNIRPRGSKIGIWTTDGTNATAILTIGNALKSALHFEDGSMQYQLHKDAMIKTNRKYTHIL